MYTFFSYFSVFCLASLQQGCTMPAFATDFFPTADDGICFLRMRTSYVFALMEHLTDRDTGIVAIDGMPTANAIALGKQKEVVKKLAAVDALLTKDKATLWLPVWSALVRQLAGLPNTESGKLKVNDIVEDVCIVNNLRPAAVKSEPNTPEKGGSTKKGGKGTPKKSPTKVKLEGGADNPNNLVVLSLDDIYCEVNKQAVVSIADGAHAGDGAEPVVLTMSDVQDKSPIRPPW